MLCIAGSRRTFLLLKKNQSGNAYGKQKKLTIAKTTQITPAQARDKAKRILALVAKSKSAKKSPYPIRRGCFSPIRLNSDGQRGLR